jgi:hypothetical protein
LISAFLGCCTPRAKRKILADSASLLREKVAGTVPDANVLELPGARDHCPICLLPSVLARWIWPWAMASADIYR